MFMSYEMLATFGISMSQVDSLRVKQSKSSPLSYFVLLGTVIMCNGLQVLSFTLSMAVLLVVLARQGYFRISKAGHVYGAVGANIAPIAVKGQVGSPLLVSPTAPPLSMVVELESLRENPQ